MGCLPFAHPLLPGSEQGEPEVASRRGPAPQSFWLPACLLWMVWCPPAIFILVAIAWFWNLPKGVCPRFNADLIPRKSRAGLLDVGNKVGDLELLSYAHLLSS